MMSTELKAEVRRSSCDLLLCLCIIFPLSSLVKCRHAVLFHHFHHESLVGSNMTSQSVTIHDVLFEALIHSSDKRVRESAYHSLVKARHGVLAEIHTRYAIPPPSLPSREVRNIVESDLLSRGKDIMTALEPIDGGDKTISSASVIEFLRKLIKRLEEDAVEAKQVEDEVEKNNIKLDYEYEKYQDLLLKYLKNYKVSSKNKLDEYETTYLLRLFNMQEVRQKLATYKEYLKSCPDEETVKQRKARAKELDTKASTLEIEIKEAEARLESFKSLPKELLEEYENVWLMLEEKKWAIAELGLNTSKTDI